MLSLLLSLLDFFLVLVVTVPLYGILAGTLIGTPVWIYHRYLQPSGPTPAYTSLFSQFYRRGCWFGLFLGTLYLTLESFH